MFLVSNKKCVSMCAPCTYTLLSVHALEEAKRPRGPPNSWFWIKGDGCDLVSGLSESTKMEWTGDVMESCKLSIKDT